jgi:small-conductance mechanosensitive channel
LLKAQAGSVADRSDSAQVRASQVWAGDSLVFTYTQELGPFSPQERAWRLQVLLDSLAHDPEVDLTRLSTRNREGQTDLLLADQVLMTLTEADAAGQGLPREVLAGQVLGRLSRFLHQEARRYTFRSLATGVVLGLLLTAAFILFIKYARRGSTRLAAALETWQQREGAALSLRGAELLSRKTLIDLAQGLFALLRTGTYLLAAYGYLVAVFGLFPWTQTWSQKLIWYVAQPAAAVFWGVVGFLPNLFFIAVISLVAYYATRLVNYLAALVETGTLELPHLPPDLVRPTRQIVKFLILVLTLVVIAPYLPGAGSAAARNLTIFFGVLISLGSTSLVGNLLSGFVLTYMRAFRLGDRVQIADTVGDVVGRSLLAVKIRTTKNEDIFIPNQAVLNDHIVNYSATAQEHGLVLHTTVTIGYDAPWRQVHALLLAAAAQTPGVMKSPEPFVLQKSLDDFYVSYELNAYTDRPNEMNAIYSALHQQIQDRFNESGVQIMSPHFESQPKQPVLPGEYLNLQQGRRPQDRQEKETC